MTVEPPLDSEPLDRPDYLPPPWMVFYRSHVDRDKLFVETVDWLRAVIDHSPPNHLELLIAAGRLRMLLTDREKLVDQVNRTRNFDLRFRVLNNRNPIALEHGAVEWYVVDGFSPRLAVKGGRGILTLKRDAFLQERIMVYYGEDVTVKNLIRYLSHVAGGVHAFPPETDEDSRDLILCEMAEATLLGGYDAPTRCMRGVADVVVEALTPLRDSIAEGN